MLSLPTVQVTAREGVTHQKTTVLTDPDTIRDLEEKEERKKRLVAEKEGRKQAQKHE